MAEKPTYAVLKERVHDLENRITALNRFQNISRTLFKISSAINTTSNLNELYKSIHGELSSVIDTTNFFIAIHDKAQDSITFPYCVDSVDEYYPPVIEISKVESLTAEVIRTGSPLLITKDEILNQRQKSLRKTPTCTPSEIWLGVPLKRETDIIGVMAVQSYDDANCYDQTDLEVMVSVADQVAIAIDRKSSEKTRRESEERYRRLTENSPDMLFRISLPNGEYEYVSPAAEKIFSYPPKTWYTNPLLIQEIIHPDFDSYFSEQWKKMINGFVPPVYEYKVVHKDKSEHWVNQRNFLVKDDHGQPVALEGVVTDITERKQAEELLLQSENRLRSTLDATPFPVAVVDLIDDKIFYWSSSAFELFGHTAATTPEWYKIAYPDPEYRQDVIERWKPFLEIAQATGKPVNTGEYHITCKDGTERICELYATFLPDNLIVTFNDITERKQAEEALQASEAHLRTLINTIPDLVWLKNSEGVYLNCNSTFEQLFGVEAAAIVGKTDYDFVSKELAEFFREHDRNTINAGKASVYEEHLTFAGTGYEGEFETIKTPMYSSEGKLLGVLGISHDITERKQAEYLLRQREATVRNKLKAIIEPEGDIREIELANIIDINVLQPVMEEFFQLTGMLGSVNDISGKELIAVGWQDICAKFHRCHPDTLKNCFESDTILTHGVVPGTFRAYRCKNNMWHMVTPLMVGGRHVGNVFIGQFFYAEETVDAELFREQAREYGFDETEYLAALDRVPRVTKEFAEAGMRFYAKLAGIISTMSFSALQQAMMLAELQQAEEKVRLLNEELEQRVSERTAQLEGANKELEAFSYSVSHDLRAPLRHIDGYVNLLVSGFRADLPDKALPYLDTISASAHKMGVLIDDLLQFSRTGRAEMCLLESTNMYQALKEALTTLWESTEGRSIEWVINDLPSVHGDHALLRQVWVNLLDNAIKYTRPREVARITVSASREKGEIIFAVADNGVGFDMKYVHKLFGVFQRLHSAEEFEGTGIGLATVQRIITRHGGRIRAEAELNVGATFYFTLPG